MKLDEAIKTYENNAEYERTHGNLQGYLEFRQLVDWLTDYERLLEQEPILDKIRAEIESLSNANPSYWNNCDVVEREDVFDIIDKYRKESEE